MMLLGRGGHWVAPTISFVYLNRFWSMRFNSFLLFYFLFFRASAQDISPEVIAAAGDSHLGVNGMQLSWSLGETAVETFNAAANRLTVGFHQMYVQPLSVPTNEPAPFADFIRVWPNPTSGILHLENGSGQSLSAVATDVSGRKVLTIQDIDIYHNIDFSNIAAGNYFLQISTKNQVITTYKIVKQ